MGYCIHNSIHHFIARSEIHLQLLILNKPAYNHIFDILKSENVLNSLSGGILLYSNVQNIKCYILNVNQTIMVFKINKSCQAIIKLNTFILYIWIDLTFNKIYIYWNYSFQGIIIFKKMVINTHMNFCFLNEINRYICIGIVVCLNV